MGRSIGINACTTEGVGQDRTDFDKGKAIFGIVGPAFFDETNEIRIGASRDGRPQMAEADGILDFAFAKNIMFLASCVNATNPIFFEFFKGKFFGEQFPQDDGERIYINALVKGVVVDVDNFGREPLPSAEEPSCSGENGARKTEIGNFGSDGQERVGRTMGDG